MESVDCITWNTDISNIYTFFVPQVSDIMLLHTYILKKNAT